MYKMIISCRAAFVAAIALALVLPACGGSSTKPSSSTNIKKLTATITPTSTSQGQVVDPATSFAGNVVTGGLLANGTVGIAGVTSGLSLNINLTNIPGPGTYSLAGGANGGTASWSGSNGLFATYVGSGSGSITFTMATTARITGTFAFVGNDIPDGNPAQRRVVVSNGVFDITVP